MVVRRVLAVAVTVFVLMAPGRRAWAWQEAHQTGDDVAVRIDPSGAADVKHTIRWHVVRGPLKFIDIVHVDPSVTLEPDVPIAAEDGRALLAHVARRDDKTVRITVDEPRALMRGNFTFDLRWHIDLVAARALLRDGATWRLTWSSPVANDAFDAAHTLLDLPAGTDAPQPIVADTGVIDDGAVSTLHREPGRDVLELVRPHVGRGEAPAWTVRIDPRAFLSISDPRLRPAADPPVRSEPDRVREASFLVGLGALALLFALGVKHKTRAFAEACASRGAVVRAFLPLPNDARAALAGLALAGGVALELCGRPTTGVACVSLATLAAALRSPTRKTAARGPGRWLALRPEDAFVPSPSAWTADAFAALLLVAGVAAAALLARRLDPEAPWLVACDAIAIVPLLITGRASQLPPIGAKTESPWLARLFGLLQSVPGLRVSPWARVPLEGDAPDELRLLVLPRAGMPGLLGIEIGVAFTATPVGWSGAPEILARVQDGSPASARLSSELPRVRLVPGRRPDERVAPLLPRSPSQKDTLALIRSLADALTDRRVTVPAAVWSAPERRTKRARPPSSQAKAAA